jgi:hypothetical protein
MLMVDSASAVGVKLLILSSEPSVTKLSKGRLQHVSHFDSKAEVSDYARSASVPFVDLHVGGYMNNFTTLAKPRPAGNGSFVVASTWGPQCRMPLIDTFHDAGLFVRLAIESAEFNKGDGKVISAYGEWITVADQIRILSEASGKEVNYLKLTDEQLGEGMKQEGTPEHVVNDMLEMFRFHEEIWEETYIHSNRDNLARQPRSFKEYCETVDWNEVFA